MTQKSYCVVKHISGIEGESEGVGVAARLVVAVANVVAMESVGILDVIKIFIRIPLRWSSKEKHSLLKLREVSLSSTSPPPPGLPSTSRRTAATATAPAATAARRPAPYQLIHSLQTLWCRNQVLQLIPYA